MQKHKFPFLDCDNMFKFNINQRINNTTNK